ncbi:MAG: aminotransferase class III-fold pyridoxal phosphate-dependent enzyme, partial [Ignavibacteria bacterium]|nr:aminotransferase class III-fold pyridoxal phosphate-dependent enzyme [Ignavibacteria bacterium]
NEKLVENAKKVGEHLKFQLNQIQDEYPKLINNVRGLGLMCSFDLPTPELRNHFRDNCYKEKLMILGCGEKSIRFRPPLNITENEIDKGLTIIRKVLSFVSSNN